MAQFDISISKTAIVDSVKQITGHVAKNVEGGMDRISVTEDESSVTDNLYSSSINVMIMRLNDFSPVLSESKIEISNPESFNNSLLPAISKSIESFLINDVCCKWFLIARQNEDAKQYSELAEDAFANVIPMLYQRKKPTKR